MVWPQAKQCELGTPPETKYDMFLLVALHFVTATYIMNHAKIPQLYGWNHAMKHSVEHFDLKLGWLHKSPWHLMPYLEICHKYILVFSSGQRVSQICIDCIHIEMNDPYPNHCWECKRVSLGRKSFHIVFTNHIIILIFVRIKQHSSFP